MRSSLFILFTLTSIFSYASDFRVVFPLGADAKLYKPSIEWSQVLPTSLGNGCKEYNYWDRKTWNKCSKSINTSSDSEAEAACEAIGGRLPTSAEFQQVLQYFSVVGGEAEICRRPSDPGYLRMQKTFKAGDYAAGDQNYEYNVDVYLWTSTVVVDSSEYKTDPSLYADVYHGFCGAMAGGTQRRSQSIGARCVRNR